MKPIILVVLICSVVRTDATLSDCFSKTSCDECITSQCMWCTDPEFTAEPRCFNETGRYNTSCLSHHIFNPKNSVRVLLNNEFPSTNHGYRLGFSSYSGSRDPYSSGRLVEYNYMSPQYIRLEIIPDKELSFQINYAQPENFAMDIYLIMDVRKSGEHKAEELYDLASKVEETLKKITSNFKIGLGYIDNNSSFTHQMSMSRNTKQFLLSVKKLSTLGTENASNVYLDAIFLSVCSTDIGWRGNSRKLLIFATNTDYQYGHVHAPIADHICNVNFGVSYTRSSFSPYPKISQINDLLNNNAINLIFAVNDNLVEKYKKLEFQIDFSAIVKLNVGTLNITDVIRDQYKELYTRVELKHNAPDYIKVKFYSNCLNSTERERERNVCNFIKGGDIIRYTVKMRALSCPDDNRYWIAPIDIYCEGLNTQVNVETKLICSCPASIMQFSENAHLCNDQGIWKDGVCKCNGTYFGKHCECSGWSDNLQIYGCRAHYTDRLECNGRGKCVCAKCQCRTSSYMENQISGKYCECDNYSCISDNGKLCSGNGECDCGHCKCKGGWAGSLCEYEDTICNKLKAAIVCSGKCEYGNCKCHSNVMKEYYDKYCEQFVQLKNESIFCSGHGMYENGTCTCSEQYFGRHCECSNFHYTSTSYECRPDNKTFTICSGRGHCICGQCECVERNNVNEIVTGQFCECDNFSCDRHKGILCSGLDHGECVCGNCECIAPWSGTSCSCRNSNDTCYQPNMVDAELCSGQGNCVCGQCECFSSDSANYSGKYCEKCPTCPGRCSEFKECVQCMMYKTGPLSEGECGANCSFVIISVNKVEDDEEEDENLCVYYDEDDCRFAYVYWYDETNKVIIKAQDERECPPKDFPELCFELKDCVECQMYGNGSLTIDECATQCTFIPMAVEQVEVTNDNEHLCVSNTQDDCQFTFMYTLDENKRPLVKAQHERNCSLTNEE